MRRNLFLIFSSLFLIGNLPAYGVEKEETILFKEKTIDLGKIGPNKKYKVTFHYKNTGEDAVFLRKVSTNCGCSQPEWSKEPLRPGEETGMEVWFDPKTKKGAVLNSIYMEFEPVSHLEIVRIKAFVEH